MDNEELTKYEKLRFLMHAMTLVERKDRRSFWLHGGGFTRIHRRGQDALFNYWKKRLDSEPEVEALLASQWQEFQKMTEHTEKIKNDPRYGPPRPVSAVDKVKSFLGAAKNLAKSGFQIADDALYNSRLEICKACPEWNPQAFLNTGQCKLCGCSTKAKLRLPLEKCPVDKWLPISAQESQSSNSGTPGGQSTQVSQ
jgi:hypothetical protein